MPTTWEERDRYGLPNEDEEDFEEQGAAVSPLQSGVTLAPETDSPFGEELSKALRRGTEHASARPQIDAPKYKPSLLRIIGAAAARGAAGYLTADGTRVNQPDVDSLTGRLLRPGYEQDVRRWEDEGQGIRSEVDAATKRYDAEVKARRLAAEQQRAQAAAQASAAREDVSRQQLINEQTPKPVNPYMNAGNGRIFNSREGKYVEPPADLTTKKPTYRTGKEAYIDTAKDEVERQKRIKEVMGLEFSKRGGGAGGAKPATPSQFRTVESTKNQRLLAAEAKYRKSVQDAEGDAGKRQAALEALNADKQQIQNAYEAEVAALGGSSKHLEYNRPSATQKPPVKASAATIPAPKPRVQAGSVVTLKNGQRVTVKKVNPDGTFEY